MRSPLALTLPLIGQCNQGDTGCPYFRAYNRLHLRSGDTHECEHRKGLSVACGADKSPRINPTLTILANPVRLDDPPEATMLTVRELFLKALSMKLSGAAWPRIQDTLISLGRVIGISDIGTDFVEFRSGQRIWFDGRCHLTTLWQGWSSMRPSAPAEEDASG